MTPTTARRLWFFGLWLMLPWAMPVFDTPFVPAVRYLILGGAASTLALAEGGAGPVAMLIVFLIVWGVLTSLLCWGIAWAVARGLSGVSQRTRSVVTWTCFALALAFALAFEPYSTPFGRAASGGLLQVLS